MKRTKTILAGAFLILFFNGNAQLSMLNDFYQSGSFFEIQLSNDKIEAESESKNELYPMIIESETGLEVISLVNEFKGILSIDVINNESSQSILLDITNWPTGVLFNLTDSRGNSVKCDDITTEQKYILKINNLNEGSYFLNIFDFTTRRSTILKITKNKTI